MNPIELMNELVRRKIKKTLANNKQTKEEAVINRNLFLKRLVESNGEILLNYIYVVDKSSLYPTKEVFDHIKSKAGITLNKIQLSFVKNYLLQIGVEFVRKEDTNYFTNLNLKD